KHPERGAGREKRGSDSGRTRHERREDFRASDVLRELSLAPGSRLDFHDLVQRMGVPSKDRTRFRHFLKELVREGLLHPAKGRGFRLDRESADQDQWAVEGIVRRHRAGYGFLSVADPERGDLEGDLFIPAREMMDIFDGDCVRAVPVPGRYGRLAGRVLRILERARKSVTGVYEKIGMREHVIPDPSLYGEPIELLPGAVEPRPGEIVEVEIRRYPEGRS